MNNNNAEDSGGVCFTDGRQSAAWICLLALHFKFISFDFPACQSVIGVLCFFSPPHRPLMTSVFAHAGANASCFTDPPSETMISERSLSRSPRCNQENIWLIRRLRRENKTNRPPHNRPRQSRPFNRPSVSVLRGRAATGSDSSRPTSCRGSGLARGCGGWSRAPPATGSEVTWP